MNIKSNRFYNIGKGFGSIFNLSGRYVTNRSYLRGDSLSDISKDWNVIGQSFGNIMRLLHFHYPIAPCRFQHARY